MERNILLQIVFTFFVGICFGVILPTLDVASDLWLMADTLNFVGDGIEMRGCKACFAQSDATFQEHQAISNNDCNICVSDKFNYGHSGIYCFGFPDPLDKIRRIQASSKCETQDWHMGLDFTFKRGACEDKDICCVHAGIKPNRSQIFSPGQDVDPRVSWVFCRNTENCRDCQSFGTCEVCLGIGSSTAPKCNNFYDNLVKSRNSFQKAGCTNQRYRLNSAINETKQFVEGECRFEDGCCINIRKTQPKKYLRCIEDVCLQHINWISTDSEIIKNISSWRGNKDIIHGRVVGGKLCSTLRIYALCMILPVLLNFVFIVLAWIKHHNEGKTHLSTLVFAIFQFYSQWKVIRYLWLFKSKNRIKEDIDRAKDHIFNIETLEPFLEATFQVHFYSN